MDAKLKTDHGKAIVEGKTAVPFKTFVGLVLQRKVLSLFKQWGKEPVIIDSELLTDLASAQQDSQENKEQLVTVTLGVGVLAGVFVLAIAQIALAPWGIYLKEREFLIIAGGILGLGVLAFALGRAKKKGKSQKLTDTMEKITSIVSK
ncbi:MAG: hypothetical protein HOG89_03895 [Candidatus Peribacter sp.]|jgi:hypothetical protein|nr:hypothetical protein [Candidatus Peribacter sp.]MBT4393110.1 hypothetical protein [Candidatus Peribacter sp.]MBT4600909.1 hypothetical protein [Candidatus Peribacter sp.]MBT5148961.1 hypothetical protein [Candidatus Peribacter sp.]MBT5638360.1 hypothetical protein [Candidatus Peribacter sp.]